MKKLILAVAVLVAATASAQVPRKIIVEHFTNTVCGICASRNPGFYTNLENHPDVLHLAIHPSAPYASCVLNQNNVAENDARTNYYGVYGGTPRLVIQGQVIPASADYSAAALFAPFENQTTPISLTVRQTKFGNDSMQVTYVTKTVAPNTLGTLVLFAALAEDTVFYNSPNGETLHHDVYRKSLAGGASQIAVTPAAVGDSVTYTVSFHTDANWDYARLFAVGILQDSTTKAVEQAAAASPQDNYTMPLSQPFIEASTMSLAIYPNPTADELTIKVQGDLIPGAQWQLINPLGQTIKTVLLHSSVTHVALSDVPAGFYLHRLSDAKGNVVTGQLIID